LVRRGGRKTGDDERNWFLFKERDDTADSSADITADAPDSVVSGRTMEQIAANQDRVWKNGRAEKQRAKSAKAAKSHSRSSSDRRKKHAAKDESDATPTAARPSAAPRAAVRSTQSAAALERMLKDAGATRGKLPKSIRPQLATLVAEVPQGDAWLYEVKFDGYRMLCRLEEGKARFISRNEQDWTNRFRALAAAAAQLNIDDAILDGEVVALLPSGASNFQALQNAFREKRSEHLIYYVFDVLYLRGYRLLDLPLIERKKILRAILSDSEESKIRFAEHLEGKGQTVFEQACKLGLEGIISKRRDQPYRPGRGDDWRKSKCLNEEEFVIGGFTTPTGSRQGFGALLLGYYNHDDLVYAGRVGTGFSDATLRDLHARMAKLERKTSPFANLAGRTGQARGVHWITPELIGQVEFSNWTADGRLRHPAFLGLREDKAAREIVRAAPVSWAETPTGDTAENGHLNPRSRAAHETHPAKRIARGAEKNPRSGAAKNSKKASAADHSAKKRKTQRSPRAEETDHDAEGPNATVAGIKLSHPDKVYYPDCGVTKRDVAEYYAAVAEWMLPHVVDRPISSLRCPDGYVSGCFFQKHPGIGVSDRLRRFKIKEKSKTEEYLVVDDAAGLVALAQMGVLEIHVWGSKTEHLETPDRLVFDLDPDPLVKWSDVLGAARDIRDYLLELGLKSWPKTSGGKGIHVVVPIQPHVPWNEAKLFCGAVAQQLAREEPTRFIATMSKAARKGKIFIDYLRNERGATAVAPYSTRARENAPVSVPCSWDELTPRFKPNLYTVQTIRKRLSQLHGDPWKDLLRCRQGLSPAIKKLTGRT
ncbi:MAG TPA: DNA ligase D, partial [Pirellulales bacterium]|nr:DNA ligase D [Pirellulales bacterium]